MFIYISYKKSLLRYFVLLYEVIKKTFKKTLYSPIFVLLLIYNFDVVSERLLNSKKIFRNDASIRKGGDNLENSVYKLNHRHPLCRINGTINN